MHISNDLSIEDKRRFHNAKRRLFDKVYSAFLNPEQCRAVFTSKGPLLVLAGAGSGKTTVLVNRISFLLKYGNAYYTDSIPDGVDRDTVDALEMAYELPVQDIEEILPQFICEPAAPWSVLAFTFTNKAAREIKERLVRTLGEEYVTDSIWAGTFHSVCLRILRKYGDRMGYREGFSIYDTDDKKRMIADCMKELEVSEKILAPKAIASAISMAKDKLQGPEEFEITNDPRTRQMKEVYRLYQTKMMEYNAVDFDDIIMQTVLLLESDDEVRGYYQRKFNYVLVDEYQDTNYAQFVLTKLLSGGYNNIMVVGDDDQSIYRFRGATIENILNCDKTYPEATVIKLEQNYRSTGNILSAANAVIAHNEGKRHKKRLWCDKGEGDKITVKEAFDQDSEGKYIVESITLGVNREKRRYSDYVVLYRVNAMGRSLQSAFTKSGMPYRVVGDIGFYDRKEVKDMVAYLSVIASATDNLRLKRIINEPKRKIGAATVDAVEELAEMNGLSMFGVMERADEYPVLAKVKDKLDGFVRLIHTVKESSTVPSEVIIRIFDDSGYKDMLTAEGFEGQGKIENVNELISAALEYEKRMRESEQEPTLLGFLEEISLFTDVDKFNQDDNVVSLMTIHAAKGLEFPVVFLAGMEDGIFPSEQNMLNEEDMSEERRLAYVAITRAKDKLYITYAKSRMMYGRTLYGRLSCFIRDEVPTALIENDTPKTPPPRQTAGYGGGYGTPRFTPQRSGGGASEFRRASGASAATPQPKERSGAESFGVEKLAVGTRVTHALFGEGVILSSKDMGGDVLYEVRFDNGQTKKLMATFAKLRKI